MADMFLSPIMEKIISAGFSYLKDQVRWQTGMKEDLEKLQENLPKVQAIVHYASSQGPIADQNSDLNKWLWKLRDAIDDADDVFDELEYMELERQLNKDKKLRRVCSIMKSVKKRVVRIGKRALKIDSNLKRLEEAVKNLDKVSTHGVETFLRLVDRAKQEQQEQLREFYVSRETGSLPKNDLIGRGEEKERVMKWLRNPSNEHGRTDLYRNISLLSVVGHGGMGKTTLLQHVYKDEEITKEFDLKMWVCVSNNFHVKKVIADMFESLKKERPRLETLEALQDSLQTEIMSKKFLLVLDDIWEEEEDRDISKWEKVLAPLASGGFGSKILITARTNSVALIFEKVIKKEVKIVQLEGLKEDECLELLISHAFADVESPNDHENLRVIAREIVKKLSNSPLAAKVIGGGLYGNLDENHWRKILESNLLDQNSINSILSLSYIVLPNHLRNCFAICCMFPQDHMYDKDDLVRMWIALGFIQPSDQAMTMEDIRGRYFDVLVKKALFDKVGDDYKMHDLIHESASKFFTQECGKFVDDEESSLKISKTIRHLSVETTNPSIIKKIGQFKYLHSLFLLYEYFNKDFCSALTEIFKTSTRLRLLYICRIDKWEMIPEDIGYLKHLRYLNIKTIHMTRLPRSISNLYHLQCIIYDQWPGLHDADDFLSSDMNHLSNLRYIKLPKNFISSISGIGKLKFLQELEMFVLRDESGYRIGELENMNDLCKLEINCLENIKDSEEACSAKLSAKKRLTDLTLCWSNIESRNIDIDENVLDNLQPPKCLRNLVIEGYMGASWSAIWMNNVNGISKLEKIELSGCLECETLPPFGQLRFLKSLKLKKLPKVKWLQSKFNGKAFPLLESLCIWELEALEDWFEAGVAAEDDGCLFPFLIKLVLKDCPKLKEFPSLPPKLESLWIEKMGWTTLNFCSNSNPIPLGTLRVLSCPNITSLPLADEIARLATLTDLIIIKCPNLISLGNYPEVGTSNNYHLILDHLWISDPSVLLMEPLRSIASLKNLIISHNDEVVSVPNEAEQWFLNVSSSLCELYFMHLKSLESLPSSLESLFSLQILQIEDVPMLRELPNLPPSLQRLTITGCHPELKERYGEDGGSDRHKIAHIPNIKLF